MPSRIVLYGATGYIGGLTAQAMVASGGRPVLVGRDRGRLSQVACGAELETVVAGTEEPGRCGSCWLPVTCWCRPPDRS